MVIEARLVIPKTEIQAADKDRNDKEYPHKQGIPSHTNISHSILLKVWFTDYILQQRLSLEAL